LFVLPALLSSSSFIYDSVDSSLFTKAHSRFPPSFTLSIEDIMPPAAGQNNPAQPVQYEIKAFSLLYATGKILPNKKPEYAQYIPESRQFTLVSLDS
jgi:hypothetical protein